MSKINPVYFVAQPRNISFTLQEFNRIDFVDRVHVKYHNEKEAYDFINDYFAKHDEYTHLMISCDDADMVAERVLGLLRTLRRQDYPVFGGVCNLCDVWRPGTDGVCTFCRWRQEHEYVNICFTLPDVDPVRGICYDMVTREEQKTINGVRKVKFQGFSPTIVRRDIALKIPFRPIKSDLYSSFDYTFAIDCDVNNIEQFVDFRVYFNHWGFFHRDVLVGIKPKEVEFVKATKPLDF